MARPGHDHPVMGCFKWAAARVLAHLVGTFISVWQGDMVPIASCMVAAPYQQRNVQRAERMRPVWLLAGSCCLDGRQTGMGDEQHSLAAELPVAAAAGVHPFGQPALPDSWAREPVLGMDFLELSDTLIAFAQYGHVLQVGSLCKCWTLPGLALHACCTMYSVCGHLAMP